MSSPQVVEIEQLRLLRNTPELLEEVQSSDLNDFQLQAALRQRYPRELVIAALQLGDARSRARSKFSRAAEMWLDGTGVEQSTSELVARHKMQRFADCGEVWDLCCGIGGDAIALAECEVSVQAVDISPLATLRTAWNAEVYGVADRVQVHEADVTTVPLEDRYVHFDPDRRAGRQRAMRLEDYAPPLEFMQRVTQTAKGGAIKLSPASNFGGKFHDCEVELISLDGECKEATIWFGDRRSEAPCRATLLPSGASLAGDPWLARAPVEPLGRYMYDPDPAIVRAGLVDVLAEEAGFGRLDAAEEYLTSEELIDSPFVRAFEVLADLPNNQRELRKALRDLNAGELEIKCRHVPVDVNTFRKKLPLDGAEKLVLLIARLDGKTRAVIARRLGESLVANSH